MTINTGDKIEVFRIKMKKRMKSEGEGENRNFIGFSIQKTVNVSVLEGFLVIYV